MRHVPFFVTMIRHIFLPSDIHVTTFRVWFGARLIRISEGRRRLVVRSDSFVFERQNLVVVLSLLQQQSNGR